MQQRESTAEHKIMLLFIFHRLHYVYILLHTSVTYWISVIICYGLLAYHRNVEEEIGIHIMIISST